MRQDEEAAEPFPEDDVLRGKYLGSLTMPQVFGDIGFGEEEERWPVTCITSSKVEEEAENQEAAELWGAPKRRAPGVWIARHP